MLARAIDRYISVDYGADQSQVALVLTSNAVITQPNSCKRLAINMSNCRTFQ